MDRISDFAIWVFMYCCDFIINVANLTGTSYYEVNAVIFVSLWPLVTYFLIIYYATLSFKLKRREIRSNPTNSSKYNS